MVKFYVLQIKMQKITLEDVPEKWRDEVKKALENERD